MDTLLSKYDTASFRKQCEELEIEISDYQITQFLKYYELLVEWNSFMNLTAITEYDEVISKHFVDSMIACKAIDFQEGDSLIDVGTGAGFPGIPLKIMHPELKVTLLDSLNKRIKFLDTVIDAIDLKQVVTVHGRAEDLAKQVEHREQYTYCVSRAVANLSTLSELCIPFIKKDGCFISYKSEKSKEEIDAAKHAIFLLGGKVIDQVECVLPNTNMYRNLVVIKKVDHTAKRYPRKAGTPAKEPLM